MQEMLLEKQYHAHKHHHHPPAYKQSTAEIKNNLENKLAM